MYSFNSWNGAVSYTHLDVYKRQNSDHGLESSGKAGRSRWMGRRPRNRGVVMNPVDHPMGGGEGLSLIHI